MGDGILGAIGAGDPYQGQANRKSWTQDELRAEARAAATRHGVDPVLYERQIDAESKFKPYAQSKAGAKGIAQFMDPTAKEVGLKDPFDPVESLDRGAFYLHKQLQRFNGNYRHAFSGYNAGGAATQKALDATGDIPDYPETRGYVNKILGQDYDDFGKSLNLQVAAQTRQSAPPAPDAYDRGGPMPQSVTGSGQRGVPTDTTPHVDLIKMMNTPAFVGSAPEVQRAWLRKHNPSAFAQAGNDALDAWIEKSLGPGGLGYAEAAGKSLVAGGVEGLAGMTRGGQGILKSMQEGEAPLLAPKAEAGPERPPLTIQEAHAQNRANRPPWMEQIGSPVAEEGIAAIQEGRDPNPLPGFGEGVGVQMAAITYPFRQALAKVSKVTGLSESETLAKLEELTGMGAEELEQAAEHWSKRQDPTIAAAYAQRLDVLPEGTPFGLGEGDTPLAAFLLELTRGGASAFVTIKALKYTGKALTAAKVPMGTAAALPAYEYYRAKGISEDEFAGATHGAALAAGLGGAAMFRPWRGAVAGAAMFGGPLWESYQKGDIELHEMLAEAILGGFFGWHGSRMLRQHQLDAMAKEAGISDEVARRVEEHIKDARPEEPGEPTEGARKPEGSDLAPESPPERVIDEPAKGVAGKEYWDTETGEVFVAGADGALPGGRNLEPLSRERAGAAQEGMDPTKLPSEERAEKAAKGRTREEIIRDLAEAEDHFVDPDTVGEARDKAWTRMEELRRELSEAEIDTTVGVEEPADKAPRGDEGPQRRTRDELLDAIEAKEEAYAEAGMTGQDTKIIKAELAELKAELDDLTRPAGEGPPEEPGLTTAEQALGPQRHPSGRTPERQKSWEFQQGYIEVRRAGFGTTTLLQQKLGVGRARAEEILRELQEAEVLGEGTPGEVKLDLHFNETREGERANWIARALEKHEPEASSEFSPGDKVKVRGIPEAELEYVFTLPNGKVRASLVFRDKKMGPSATFRDIDKIELIEKREPGWHFEEFDAWQSRDFDAPPPSQAPDAPDRPPRGPLTPKEEADHAKAGGRFDDQGNYITGTEDSPVINLPPHPDSIGSPPTIMRNAKDKPWKRKADAEKKAATLRLTGHEAEVIKEGDGWVVRHEVKPRGEAAGDFGPVDAEALRAMALEAMDRYDAADARLRGMRNEDNSVRDDVSRKEFNEAIEDAKRLGGEALDASEAWRASQDLPATEYGWLSGKWWLRDSETRDGYTHLIRDSKDPERTIRKSDQFKLEGENPDDYPGYEQAYKVLGTDAFIAKDADGWDLVGNNGFRRFKTKKEAHEAVKDPEVREDLEVQVQKLTSGAEKIAEHRELMKGNVEELERLIYDHLADGSEKTFNRIGVELFDKTADVLHSTKASEALWNLVERGQLEHRQEAPIRFRRRRGEEPDPPPEPESRWGPEEHAEPRLPTDADPTSQLDFMPARIRESGETWSIAAESPRSATARTFELSLPGGEKVRAVLGIVELDSLNPSHKRQGKRMLPNPEYDPDLQTRDYTNQAKRSEQIVNDALPKNFDPRFLMMMDPSGNNGPIVAHTKNADILSGTRRWNILNEVRNRDENALREMLDGSEKSLGFEDGESARFSQPVLVLWQLNKRPQSTGDARVLSDAFNAPRMARMSLEEEAIGAASRIGDQTIKSLEKAMESAADDVTLAELVQRVDVIDGMIGDGVIPRESMDAWVKFEQSPSGPKIAGLTEAGRSVAKGAVLGHLFPQKGLVERMPPDIRAKLEKSAAAVMAAQNAKPGYLDSLIEGAVDSEIQRRNAAKQEGSLADTVEGFLAEEPAPGMGIEPSPAHLDPRVATLQRLMAPEKNGGMNQAEATKKFKHFAKLMRDDAAGEAGEFFSAAIEGDPGEAFKQAFNGPNTPEPRNADVDVRPGDRAQVPPVDPVPDYAWIVGQEFSRLGKRGLSLPAWTVTEVIPPVGRQKGPRFRVEYEREPTDAEKAAERQGVQATGREKKTKVVTKAQLENEVGGLGEGPQVNRRTEPLDGPRNRFNDIGAEVTDPAELRARIRKLEEEGGAVEKQGPGDLFQRTRDVDLLPEDAPPPEGIVRRGEILKRVMDHMGWTINFGRLRAKGVSFTERDLGFQQSPQQRMMSRGWWHLNTSFHEIGHQLLDHYPHLRGETMFRLNELNENSHLDAKLPPHLKQMLQLSYEKTEPHEGFAEGIRQYFVGNGRLRTNAPDFTVALDNFFSSLPKRDQRMWSKVMQDTESYFRQGGEANYAELMGKEAYPTWYAYNTSLARFTGAMVDGFNGFFRLEGYTTGRHADMGLGFFSRMTRGIPAQVVRLNEDGYPVYTGTGVEFRGDGLRRIVGRSLGEKPRMRLVAKRMQFVDTARAWHQYGADMFVDVKVRRLVNEDALLMEAEDARGRPERPKGVDVNVRGMVQFGESKEAAFERLMANHPQLRDLAIDDMAPALDAVSGKKQGVGLGRPVVYEEPVYKWKDRRTSGRDPWAGREWTEKEYKDMREAIREQAKDEGLEGDAVEARVDQLMSQRIMGSNVGFGTNTMLTGLRPLIYFGEKARERGITPQELRAEVREKMNNKEPVDPKLVDAERSMRLFEELTEFNERVADYAEDMGLIGYNQRAMWPWASYAVSFMREMYPDKKQQAGEAGISTKRPIFRLGDSTRNFKDPLTRLFEGPARMMFAAQYNLARQKTARHLLMPKGGIFGGEIRPGTDLWKIKVETVRERIMEEIKQDMSKAGIEIPEGFMKDDFLPEFITLLRGGREVFDKDVMTVFVPDGKGNAIPRFFHVTDPSLMHALQHMHKDRLNWFNRLGNVMRMTLQSSVIRGPDFMVGQLMRDPVANWMFSRKDKDWWITTAQGYANAAHFALTGRNKLALRAIQNLGGGGMVGELGFNPSRSVGGWAMDAGGVVSEGSILSRTANWMSAKGGHRAIDYRRGRSLVKYARRKNEGLSIGERARGYEPTLMDGIRLLDRSVMLTEMGPRLGEMIRAERAGKRGYELGKYYREASVDFAQGGTHPFFEFMVTWTPFLRAQVASWDRFQRAVGAGEAAGKVGAKLQETVGERIGSGLERMGAQGAATHFGKSSRPRSSRADAEMKARTVMKILAMMAGSMGLHAWNRGFEDYNEQPSEKKILYNYFYYPTGLDKDGRMGFSWDRFTGARPYDAGLFTGMGDMFLENLLESEDPQARGHGIMLTWMLDHHLGIGMPPVIGAIMQAGYNRDAFTGNPLLGPDLVLLEEYAQVRPDTSKSLAWIAEKLRDTPISFSPALMQKQIGLLLATWAAIIPDVMDDKFFFRDEATEKGAHETPGLKRLVPAPEGTRTKWQADYYALREAVVEADATRKALIKRGRADLLAEDYEKDPETGEFPRRAILAGQAGAVRKTDQALEDININLRRASEDAGSNSDEYLNRARDKTAVLRNAVQGISEALREIRD